MPGDRTRSPRSTTSRSSESCGVIRTTEPSEMRIDAGARPSGRTTRLLRMINAGSAVSVVSRVWTHGALTADRSFQKRPGAWLADELSVFDDEASARKY